MTNSTKEIKANPLSTVSRKDLYLQGLKAGWPIALGYFAVSAAFGMAAIIQGMTVHEAVMISLTNLTSAGQFAGTALISKGASIAELVLSQCIINARYFLMSASIAQKLPSGISFWQRMIMAFGMTDEIFAVASSHTPMTFLWFAGLMTLPILGWSLGTWTGACANAFLPDTLVNALGLALYGMFIAIFVPEAKKKRPVLYCVLLAGLLSCLFSWVPLLQSVSSGYVIVFVTIAVCALMAYCHPIVPDASIKKDSNHSADERKNASDRKERA